MGWREDTSAVVARTKNDYFWVLTSNDHPDHKIWRSRMTEKVTGVPAQVPVQSEKTVISTGNGGMALIPLAESLQLNKEMRECPHYEKRGCHTCGKAFCKAGKGEPGQVMNVKYSLVTTWDCYHCLRPDVELYAINAYKKI